MPKVLTLMDARRSGYITRIRGNDSNIGMTIEVRNDSDAPITITADAGTVIGSKDPGTQKMIVTRDRAWTVPAGSTVSIPVDALCLEAHKAPPRSDVGDTDHDVDGPTGDDDIKGLLEALREIEATISENVVDHDAKSRTVRHTLADERLIELAKAASHANVEGENKYLSQIYDAFVQMAVWQLTDHLTMTEYAKIVGRDRPQTLEELRATVAMLTRSATIAEILLDEAELSSKQTIEPPADDLEVLYVEHELLSADVSRLRRESITAGADRESLLTEMRGKAVLLGQKEREIAVQPRKGLLIDKLSSLPLANNLTGRTALLSGMRADGLDRDEGNKLLDLDLMVTQLARLGRDDRGNVLLVKLIDNALPYAEGYEVHAELVALSGEIAALLTDQPV